MKTASLRSRALATAAICLLSAVWNAGAAQAVVAGPMLSLRADHMVLDAAAHGSKLLVATQSGQLGAFDWREGRVEEPLLVLEPPEGQELPPTLSSVAVSPSGQLCATISSDGRLRVGRLGGPGGPGVLEPLFSKQRSGLLIARFLDEERLLLGDMRGELALLDLVSEREVYRRQLDYDPIYALAVGPERRRVAVALRSSRIQIVDAESGATLHVLEGHRDSVFDVLWLGVDRLASGSKDKSLLLWDISRNDPKPRLLYAGDHYITALALEPRSETLAFTLDHNRVGILRLADQHITQRLEGHTAPVQVLLFVDAGRRLISAGNDARVLVWNLEAGSQTGESQRSGP